MKTRAPVPTSRGAEAPKPRRSAVLVAFAALYLAWGSTYLGIRCAIETLPPLLMAGARHLIAGAVLYAIARALGAPRPGARQLLPSILLGALLLVGGNGATVWAQRHLASGFTALLVASTPLWVAILSRRLSGRVLAGLAAGSLGVALLVRPGGGTHLPSVFLLLGGTLSFAIGSLYSRRAAVPASTGVAVGLQMMAGGLLLLALGEGAGERFESVSSRSLVAFVYLVVVGSIVGYTAFTWLLRVCPPTRVATYAYVNPMVALVLGWAVVGEPLSLSMILPAALIVLALILVTRSKEVRPCDSSPARASGAPSTCRSSRRPRSSTTAPAAPTTCGTSD